MNRKRHGGGEEVDDKRRWKMERTNLVSKTLKRGKKDIQSNIEGEKGRVCLWLEGSVLSKQTEIEAVITPCTAVTVH